MRLLQGRLTLRWLVSALIVLQFGLLAYTIHKLQIIEDVAAATYMEAEEANGNADEAASKATELDTDIEQVNERLDMIETEVARKR